LLDTLDELMRDATAGDPITGLKWTHQSLRAVAWELERQGYAISAPRVARLLRARDYSFSVNRKRLAGKQAPGRDEQFLYLAQQRAASLRQRRPVISVATKKKELIGNFKQPGRQWRQSAHEVWMYDFPSDAIGIAIPYGIYDVGRNQGYIVIGTSHATPQFAVAAIRSWWIAVGRKAYPGQTELLIEADCGGSNGNRCLAWKAHLQDFADEFGLRITVTHYPTGASKWNPIEHRCFNLLSGNWAGQPLDSYETVLKHIRATKSTTGFGCKARLDKKVYATGVKISPEEAAGLRLVEHQVFPLWKYTVCPRISL
jgi:Rhodopirellula transposase DDE domain